MIKDKILVIDDEAGIRSSLKGILEDEGYIVKTTSTGEKGLDLIRGENFDVLLLDIWLPEMSGLDVLQKLKASEDNIKVIMITGHGTIETAVKATKLGAFDFLEKPLSLEKVVVTVKNALQQKRLEEENIQLREKVRAKSQLVGKSSCLQKIREQIKKVSPTNALVLIQGEGGTGKELIARLIHQNSHRRHKNFMKISTAAIPEELIESQLFGNILGAFPNAKNNKKGKISEASDGTLFLDEIGELSLSTQDKLIGFIEEKTFEPLGTDNEVTADVRIISATQYDLKNMIGRGRFREELFFKINASSFTTAPLRKIKEDIPVLIDHYLRLFAVEYGMKPKSMSPEVTEAFMHYSWPGNVNELINVIERFVIMVKEQEITVDHLGFLVEPRESALGAETEEGQPFEQAKAIFEKNFIQKTLIRHDWNLAKAASELKMDEEQLHGRMRSLGISILS